jgi:hypothetical protein
MAFIAILMVIVLKRTASEEGGGRFSKKKAMNKIFPYNILLPIITQ